MMAVLMELVSFWTSLANHTGFFIVRTVLGSGKITIGWPENAKGEYLLFLNNDAFVSGNWLHPMLSVFKNQSKVGFVGNVQRLAGTRRYDHMGVVFSPLGNPRHYGQGFFHRPFKG
jgi:GT2 family glycosyltransferase